MVLFCCTGLLRILPLVFNIQVFLFALAVCVISSNPAHKNTYRKQVLLILIQGHPRKDTTVQLTPNEQNKATYTYISKCKMNNFTEKQFHEIFINVSLSILDNCKYLGT